MCATVRTIIKNKSWVFAWGSDYTYLQCATLYIQEYIHTYIYIYRVRHLHNYTHTHTHTHTHTVRHTLCIQKSVHVSSRQASWVQITVKERYKGTIKETYKETQFGSITVKETHTRTIKETYKETHTRTIKETYKETHTRTIKETYNLQKRDPKVGEHLVLLSAGHAPSFLGFFMQLAFSNTIATR